MSDLIGTDAKISKDGTVTGNIKKIEEPWTEFDSDNNTGHFFPFKVADKFKGKTATFKGRNAGDRKITIPDDLLIVQRIENLTTAKKLTVTVESESFSLDFTGATLEGSV